MNKRKMIEIIADYAEDNKDDIIESYVNNEKDEIIDGINEQFGDHYMLDQIQEAIEAYDFSVTDDINNTFNDAIQILYRNSR